MIISYISTNANTIVVRAEFKNKIGMTLPISETTVLNEINKWLSLKFINEIIAYLAPFLCSMVEMLDFGVMETLVPTTHKSAKLKSTMLGRPRFKLNYAR